MRYYRYMSMQGAMKALDHGEFIVQLPSKFDDPFECRGVLNSVTWKPSALDQFYRILCLCKEEGHNDMLFWSSSYSDYGKGIRIGFEFDGPIGDGIEICDVKYLSELPTMSWDEGLAQELKVSVVRELLKESIVSKSNHWSWQNECRLLVEYVSPLCNKRACDSPEWKAKGVTETCSINLGKYVREIVFGSAMGRENVSDDLISKYRKRYSQAAIYVVQQDSRAYQYRYERVT